MLFNSFERGDVRVAITKGDHLGEFFVDRPRTTPATGNIYRGRVVNIEPSIQAAFIDIGWKKNGFLHASDVLPPDGGYAELLGRTPSKKKTDRKLNIEEMLTRGQDVLVQVAREPFALKGPSLTTYISLPGRYLVMMPAASKVGVSRRIENRGDRRDLRQKLDDLNPPKDVGLIIRTAGMGRAVEDLKRDLEYLNKLWETVKTTARESTAPKLLYRDTDLIIRTLRDYYNSEVDEIWCDTKSSYDQVIEFLNWTMPDATSKVQLHTDRRPLFNAFGMIEEVKSLTKRKVAMPGGGSLVIEQTEALVAIDVNSGKYREKDTMDETILDINLQAAPVIARQMRLRDLGGLIMIDFIDMRSRSDRRKVEEALKKELRLDKARINILPISGLGVVELTRQRTRQTVNNMLFEQCPCCKGLGLIRSTDTLLFDILRDIREVMTDATSAVRITLAMSTALELSNIGRAALLQLEDRFSVLIEVVGSDSVLAGQCKIEVREDGKWKLSSLSEVENVVRSG